jgi:hypothetical protein
MANFYQEQPVTDPDALGYETTTDLATFWSSATEELIVDYSNKKIALKVITPTGSPNNLTNDGATLKAVYSKLKDAWKDDSTLIKFPFPMVPITDEQFELVDGWNWDKIQTSGTDAVAANTVELLRTGGWAVKNTATPPATVEEWSGVISLGALGNTDQVYYDQIGDETTNDTVNFKLKGKVNQAVQVYRDDDGDGVTNENNDYNRRSSFKMFVREWDKLFAVSEFSDIGVPSANPQAYRFPLTNSADLKVIHAEEILFAGLTFTTPDPSFAASNGGEITYTTSSNHGLVVGETVTITGVTPSGYNLTSKKVTATPTVTSFVIGTSTDNGTISDPGTYTSGTGSVTKDVFTNMTLNYVRDESGNRITNAKLLGDFVATKSDYVTGDVVKYPTGSSGRYYEARTAYSFSSPASNPDVDTTNWQAFTGERLINGVYYPFTVVIDGDSTLGSPLAPDGGPASTVDIYEFAQYKLRSPGDIDGVSGGVTVIGQTAETLVRFVGDTLVTSRGVYIDSFATADTNAIEFFDASNAQVTFNFVAQLTVNFGANLSDDENAKYFVFFSDDPNFSYTTGFGNAGAIQVQDNNGDTIGSSAQAGESNNLVNPSWPTKRSSVTHSYNYDGNIQRGAGTFNATVPITVVGIGLGQGQYVNATGSIARSKTNTVSLIAALERNYSTGSV